MAEEEPSSPESVLVVGASLDPESTNSVHIRLLCGMS